MKFPAFLIDAVALNAPILAVPATDCAAFTVEEPASIVSCKPKLNNMHEKLFKVDVGVAKAQAKKAGCTTGKV